MYAIIRSGNQEFKVKIGDFIRVSSLQKASEAGSSISLSVLGFEEGDKFYLEEEDLKKANVTAHVLRHGLSKKIIVFKKKRRKGYRKTRGHRQTFTELRVSELKSPSGNTLKVEPKTITKEASAESVTKNDLPEKKKTSTQKTASSVKEKKA